MRAFLSLFALTTTAAAAALLSIQELFADGGPFAALVATVAGTTAALGAFALGRAAYLDGRAARGREPRPSRGRRA